MPNKLVLMLEDDSDDRYLTQSTLKESAIDVEMKFVSTAGELFNYLTAPEKPALILID